MSEALRERLIAALALKGVARRGWQQAGVPSPESVADHSWGVAWLVLALAPASLNLGRALGMAVLHDLAEVRTGDVTPADGVSAAAKAAAEDAAMAALLDGLPRAAALDGLWREYLAQATEAARFVKACDRLEMALQAAVYEGETRLDLSAFVRSALRALPEGLLRTLAGPRSP